MLEWANLLLIPPLQNYNHVLSIGCRISGGKVFIASLIYHHQSQLHIFWKTSISASAQLHPPRITDIISIIIYIHIIIIIIVLHLDCIIQVVAGLPRHKVRSSIISLHHRGFIGLMSPAQKTFNPNPKILKFVRSHVLVHWLNSALTLLHVSASSPALTRTNSGRSSTNDFISEGV